MALAAAAGAGALAAWLADRRRSRRRNGQGACASCGVSWGETASAEPYLIHGRLVCERCAEKARRHIPWEYGALATAAAVATGFMVAGKGLVAMVLFPAGSTIVMTLAAVELMKLANRRAQRRIAAGESPDIEALHAERAALRAGVRHRGLWPETLDARLPSVDGSRLGMSDLRGE